MSDRQVDVLFINPGAANVIYQGLSDKFTATEPPTWALLLASACKRMGFGCNILDADAEQLDDEAALKRIEDVNPRLVCFVVYGQNPNSGTTSMVGATRLAEFVRLNSPNYPICFIGSHASALPNEVLGLKYVDFVCINEGVRALCCLLSTDFKTDLHRIPGLGYKEYTNTYKGNECLRWSHHHMNNGTGSIIPSDKLDEEIPDYAWDLLPYKNKPLDMYRAHIWHGDYDFNKTTPFASIYTTLGCNFKCSFCIINLINRTDSSDGIHSANSNLMRYWSPDHVIKQIDRLYGMGVRTLRIADELFFFNKYHFEPILNKIIERGYGGDLNIWVYSRCDTIREKYLDMFKKAGIHWLALGIEAGNQAIRQEVSKGSFKDVNIRDVVQKIKGHDLNVIGNYIYGLPGDTKETMQQTLDLAIELNTESYNAYAAQALPGSPLYYEAIQKKYKLPQNYAGWSFLSYDTLPLPTDTLTAEEILRFRDDAWQIYFNGPEYLSLVEKKFGIVAVNNIKDMSKIKLKRKILGD
jgi:radical SAM superfamily enzyme YgiQ (UPF0313 family)